MVIEAIASGRTPEPHAAAIRWLAAHFGWELVGEAARPLTQSVINANYRVETANGPVMMRAHKATMPRERIELEHHAVRWAGERGLPTNPPFADRHGETVFEIDGQLWAAFPWIEGHSLLRRTVTPDEAELLGATHALSQQVLREYPAEGLHRNSELSWETEKSLADLRQITAAIEAVERPTDAHRQHAGWVAAQMEMLETEELRGPEMFADLPVQACHGDFHERNVMLDDANRLLAVIDWERFCLSVPAVEVVRAVTFALLWDEPHLQRYLQGYGSVGRLDAETIRPSVELWWQSSVHNTWAYRDGYIRGNANVVQFFEEGAEMLRRYRDPAWRAYLAGEMLRLCG